MTLLDTAQQFDGAVGLIHLLPDGDERGVEVGVTQTVHLKLQLVALMESGEVLLISNLHPAASLALA